VAQPSSPLALYTRFERCFSVTSPLTISTTVASSILALIANLVTGTDWLSRADHRPTSPAWRHCLSYDRPIDYRAGLGADAACALSRSDDANNRITFTLVARARSGGCTPVSLFEIELDNASADTLTFTALSIIIKEVVGSVRGVTGVTGASGANGAGTTGATGSTGRHWRSGLRAGPTE